VARLRYEFTAVPAPLLPCFIVRTFFLIQPSRLWQRGAMLRYSDARARVWTTVEETYLFATVAGPKGDRPDLLSIIRGTLMELFGEYKELHVTEQQWFDGQLVPRATLERFGVLEPEWVGNPAATRRQIHERPGECAGVAGGGAALSHKDDFWMQSLMPVLKIPGTLAKPWNDKEIRPGMRWDKEIKDAMRWLFCPRLDLAVSCRRFFWLSYSNHVIVSIYVPRRSGQALELRI
jgi:hypothetical protein